MKTYKEILQEGRVKIVKTFDLTKTVTNGDTMYSKGTYFFQGKVRDVYDMRVKAKYQQGYSSVSMISQDLIQAWLKDGTAVL